jgi:F0F1-type ATP synthase membrane subunit b/b'
MFAPLHAEVDLERVLSYVVAALGSGGLVAVAMNTYFSWTTKKRDAAVADADANRGVARRDSDLLSDQFKLLLEESRQNYKAQLSDLREVATKHGQELAELQEKTTQKIIAASEAHQECEKALAVMRERMSAMEERLKAVERRS